MYDRTEILAIVPARGGSKGVPKKNLHDLNGKPLIAHTIEAAKKSHFIDRVIVSTDSEEIGLVSKRFGAEVPFYRPAKYAEDTSPSWEVIVHALQWLEQNENKKYSVFCLLQPTSPFRTSDHIDKAIKRFFTLPGAESLVSVCESAKNPFWAQTVSSDGFLQPLIQSNEKYVRRQDVPKTFDLNGAIYISETESFLRIKTFLGEKTALYEMDKYTSLDIDSEVDFMVAEALCAKKAGK